MVIVSPTYTIIYRDTAICVRSRLFFSDALTDVIQKLIFWDTTIRDLEGRNISLFHYQIGYSYFNIHKKQIKFRFCNSVIAKRQWSSNIREAFVVGLYFLNSIIFLIKYNYIDHASTTLDHRYFVTKPPLKWNKKHLYFHNNDIHTDIH